jgi:hypothetical protein
MSNRQLRYNELKITLLYTTFGLDVGSVDLGSLAAVTLRYGDGLRA